MTNKGQLAKMQRELIGLHLQLAAEKTRQDDLEREHKPATFNLKSSAEINAAYAGEGVYQAAFDSLSVIHRQPYVDAWAKAAKGAQ